MAMTTPDRYTSGAYLMANPDWHEFDSGVKAGLVLETIRTHGLQPSSIWDVGCGTGGVAALVQDALPHADVRGYDVSPQAITRGQQQHPRLDLRLGSVPESGETADLLLLLDVFEHVEDYLGFLRKLCSRSRYFVFHIPLDMTVQRVLRMTPILLERKQVGHLHYFSKETAFATLGDAGYSVVSYRYTRAGINNPHLPIKTRVANIPRWLTYWLSPDWSVRVLGGRSLLVLATGRDRLIE
jgi:SAM-dependent methyltransferase